MPLKTEFLCRTKMRDVNGSKKGVGDLLDYLTEPENLYKMIAATELGLPVLSLVATGLEKKFDSTSSFPVVKVGADYNATNRQNVGRVVKFLMGKMGYEPVAGKLDPQCRIPTAVGAEHFSTSAVYKKTSENPEYAIKLELVQIEKEY